MSASRDAAGAHRLRRWHRRRRRARVSATGPIVVEPSSAAGRVRRALPVATLTGVLLHRFVDEIIDAAFELARHLLECLPEHVPALEGPWALLVRIRAHRVVGGPQTSRITPREVPLVKLLHREASEKQFRTCPGLGPAASLGRVVRRRLGLPHSGVGGRGSCAEWVGARSARACRVAAVATHGGRGLHLSMLGRRQVFTHSPIVLTSRDSVSFGFPGFGTSHSQWHSSSGAHLGRGASSFSCACT